MHEVVIAGGGPTGLMLAGELALAGADVAIVERRTSQDLPGQRAGGGTGGCCSRATPPTCTPQPEARASARRLTAQNLARRDDDRKYPILLTQVLRATDFLPWLSDRGLTLSGCRQADLHAWHAWSSENHRNAVRPFLQWCMANKLTGRFQLPQAVTGHSAPMPDPERIEHLGRVLTDGALPLRTRAAAAIVLLYAQPASRIVRLAVNDVTCEDGEVFLRLGDLPSPVPGPVASILLSWIGSRTNMRTATNRNSAWLFPARRAAQPMRPDYLARLLNGCRSQRAGVVAWRRSVGRRKGRRGCAGCVRVLARGRAGTAE